MGQVFQAGLIGRGVTLKTPTADGVRGAALVTDGAKTLTLQPTTGEVNAKHYGALGDGGYVIDAVLNGTTTVTSATANFTSADVGKVIWGVESATGDLRLPVTTIVSVESATSITVADAGGNFTDINLAWGTDDTDALVAAYEAARDSTPRKNLYVPTGRYVFRKCIVDDNYAVPQRGVGLIGDGADRTIFHPRPDFDWTTVIVNHGILNRSVNVWESNFRGFALENAEHAFVGATSGSYPMVFLSQSGRALPTLDAVSIRGFRNMLAAIKIQATGECLISRLHSYGNGAWGVYVNSAFATFVDMFLSNGNGHGMVISQIPGANNTGYGIKIFGGFIDEHLLNSLQIDAVSDVTLIGTKIMSFANVAAVAITNNSVVRFTNCELIPFATSDNVTGIAVEAGSTAYLSGCRIQGTGTGEAVTNSGTVHDLGGNTFTGGTSGNAMIRLVGGGSDPTELRFYDGNDHYTAFRAGDEVDTDVTYQWPTGVPNDNDVLTSLENGIMSWQSPSGGTPGGSDTELQFNDDGAFGGIAGATWDGTRLTVPNISTNIAGEDNFNEGYGFNVLANIDSSALANTGVGYGALGTLIDGSENVAVGRDALFSTEGGENNTAIGTEALLNALGADDNVAVGHKALEDVSTGDRNVGVGRYAGVGLTTGSDNIFLGFESGGLTTESNTMVVGSANAPINDVYFGKGISHSTATGYTIHGTSGSGGNKAGGSVTIAGGASTGTGTGGPVVISVASTGEAGSDPNAVSGVATFTAAHVTLGGFTDATELRLLEPDGANYTGFVAPALEGDVIYTLPVADGTDGQVLSTDGAGVLEWVDQSEGGTPGGNTTELQFNDAGAFGGVTGATWDGTTLAIPKTSQFIATAVVGLAIEHAANADAVTIGKGAIGIALKITTDGFSPAIVIDHSDAIAFATNNNKYGITTDVVTSQLGNVGALDYEYAAGKFTITHNGEPTTAKNVFGVKATAVANDNDFIVHGVWASATSASGTAYGVYSAAGNNYFAGSTGFGSQAYFPAETNNAPSGTTQTINWPVNLKQKLDLSGASGTVELTFTAPSGPTNVVLRVIQGGTPRAITWPATVVFKDGDTTDFVVADKVFIVSGYFDGTIYWVGVHGPSTAPA